MAADGQPVKLGSLVTFVMDNAALSPRPAIVTDLCTSDVSGLSRVNLMVFTDFNDLPDVPLQCPLVMFRTDGQPNSWNWPV